MKRNQPEREIQNTILEYLKLKDIFHWRQKNTGFKMDDRWIPSGTKGLPDIFIVMSGQIIGCEVKAKNGKLSEHQLAFAAKLERAGGRYILVRDLDELIKFL